MTLKILDITIVSQEARGKAYQSLEDKAAKIGNLYPRSLMANGGSEEKEK